MASGMMSEIRKTVLHDRHVALGAKMVEFGGWDMPLHYPGGIIEEHLKTRKSAGLFDVSHMGRFAFRGPDAMAFLQHVLTNNAAALNPGQAQYTMIPNDHGGAIDDAYLYRFQAEEYLLVVNAANRQKDWDHLQAVRPAYPDLEMTDRTDELSMLSLQGPLSQQILAGLLDSGAMPEPARNALSVATIRGARVRLGRTGYTGEPLCFELMLPREAAGEAWDLLLSGGAVPVGLGARDTLRLEAALPLYGHELGADAEGKDIPIFACPLARFAASFASPKGDFIGRAALARQYEANRRFGAGDYSALDDLPRKVVPLALLGKGVARAGAKVCRGNAQALGAPLGGHRPERAGCVTSGTMVPYWRFQGDGPTSGPSDAHAMRAIGLALVDSRLREGEAVTVDVRGSRIDAMIVPRHLYSGAPPYARPVLCQGVGRDDATGSER